MSSFFRPSCAGSRSKGVSLIEMMVAIAVSAVLLGVATSFLWSIRSRDQQIRHTASHTLQSFRLATRLRADIRRAADVLPSEDGSLVVMSPRGAQTRYELTPRGCVRSVVAAGDAAAARDEFAVGRAEGWSVDRLSAGRRPLVTVALLGASDDAPAGAQPLLVYAALGADLPAETESTVE
jgi:prepilin-type N-terminal cleavage/methylation domain-containing protein